LVSPYVASQHIETARACSQVDISRADYPWRSSLPNGN
jgi:hypothetical protein